MFGQCATWCPDCYSHRNGSVASDQLGWCSLGCWRQTAPLWGMWCGGASSEQPPLCTPYWHEANDCHLSTAAAAEWEETEEVTPDMFVPACCPDHSITTTNGQFSWNRLFLLPRGQILSSSTTRRSIKILSSPQSRPSEDEPAKQLDTKVKDGVHLVN